MPDFNIEVFYHCQSAEYFSTEVQGSKKYTVSYGETPHGKYERDYQCTCDGFKFKKQCRHIDQVKKSGKHCNWMQFIEGEQPIEVNGEKCCPKCKLPAFPRRLAV